MTIFEKIVDALSRICIVLMFAFLILFLILFFTGNFVIWPVVVAMFLCAFYGLINAFFWQD